MEATFCESEMGVLSDIEFILKECCSPEFNYQNVADQMARVCSLYGLQGLKVELPMVHRLCLNNSSAMTANDMINSLKNAAQ